MDWTKTTWGLLVIAWTAAMLAIAAVLEHGFGMIPCPLCLMQRFWFVVAGLVALGGIAHNPRLGIYPLMTIVAALVGGGFAIRQLWVESLPPGEAACLAPIDQILEAGRVGEALRAMTLGTADCAATPPFLGLSLAVWALLGFAGVAAGAAMQWGAGAWPRGSTSLVPENAGGIVALTAGIFGTCAAVATLFVAGLGNAVEAEGADTVLRLGWGGIVFSFLTIVLGAVAIGATGIVPGILLIVCAILGALLGGTIVAVFMVLALIGGVLATIGAKQRRAAGGR